MLPSDLSPEAREAWAAFIREAVASPADGSGDLDELAAVLGSALVQVAGILRKLRGSSVQTCLEQAVAIREEIRIDQNQKRLASAQNARQSAWKLPGC